MFRRAWSPIVAAGIIALFACLASAQDVLSQGIGEEQKAGQQAQEDRPDEPAVEDPVVPPAEAPQTDLPADNAEQDEQVPEQEQAPSPVFDWGAFVSAKDTLAQWLMAILGVIATGISIMAVYLLKRTLEATRLAVNQAEEGTRAAHVGAEAAREANKITREAYMAQQRPWLRWEIIQPISINRHGNSLRVDISAVLENFGNTPARNVFCFAEFYIPPPKEAAVNRGLRFHQDHLDEYQSAMFPFYDILPKEKTPMAFGPILRIDEFIREPQKQFTLYLSFHAAYRFWEGPGIGEIGAIYMLVDREPQRVMFSIENLDSLNAYLMEIPGGRRIT